MAYYMERIAKDMQKKMQKIAKLAELHISIFCNYTHSTPYTVAQSSKSWAWVSGSGLSESQACQWFAAALRLPVWAFARLNHQAELGPGPALYCPAERGPRPPGQTVPATTASGRGSASDSESGANWLWPHGATTIILAWVAMPDITIDPAGPGVP